MKNTTSQSGLTMVELAIAVTIIGLLLAGILGGNSLVQSAKIRKVVTELTSYKTAISEFEQEYRYLPGDLPIASTYWSGANNGNGNSKIDWDGNVAVKQEDLFFWEHLRRAGLVEGKFTGDVYAAGTIRYAIDENAPGSKAYKTAIYSFNTPLSYGYKTHGDQIKLASLQADGRPYNGFLTAKEAYSIDLKMDDGIADSGTVYTIRGANGSECVTAIWTATAASYDLDSTEKSCEILYWYRKY